MKVISLFDIDTYVKSNNIKEVTSKRIYNGAQNSYNPTGLFSEEIFGQTSDERRYRAGYIKLPIHVFNPDIATFIISRSGGIIRKIAFGEVKCDIEDGELKPKPDGKYCGLKDLYEIWDQLDLDKNIKSSNQDKLTILKKSPKRLIFNDKVLVCPPELRPAGMKNGKMVKNELNTIYMNILGLKNVTSHTTSTSTYQIYNKFQEAVINIFQYVKNYTSGKTGFFQKHLLSKTTTHAAWNVISAPSYNKEEPDIGIFKTGYPLDACISMFAPLIKFKLKQYLSFNSLQSIAVNKDEIKSNDIMNIYDDKMLNDMISIFKENPGSRFDKIFITPDQSKWVEFEYFDVNANKKIQRPLTMTDVMYMCAKSVIVDADRHVYTLRFPVGDIYGFFFSKVHILSTIKTTKIQFNGETIDTYPLIDMNAPHRIVATSFAQTINMSNSRLKALGADYDGDTVKSIGLWTDESNKKAEELMYSKLFNVKPQGTSVYTVSVDGLFALTRK